MQAEHEAKHGWWIEIGKDMSSQQTCVGLACSDKEPQESFQLSERLLNDAIVRAAIRRSFEEHLEIGDRFYADEIVLTSAETRPPIPSHKAGARHGSRSLRFWVPQKKWGRKRRHFHVLFIR